MVSAAEGKIAYLAFGTVIMAFGPSLWLFLIHQICLANDSKLNAELKNCVPRVRWHSSILWKKDVLSIHPTITLRLDLSLNFWHTGLIKRSSVYITFDMDLLLGPLPRRNQVRIGLLRGNAIYVIPKINQCIKIQGQMGL